MTRRGWSDAALEKETERADSNNMAKALLFNQSSDDKMSSQCMCVCKYVMK